MTESLLTEDTPMSPSSDPTGMTQDLGRRYKALRRQFESDHPELFPANEMSLTRAEVTALSEERDRQWTLSLGLDLPPVPSSLDASRDASCLRCRDVGWVHPGGYAASVVPCRHCNPQEEARQKARMAYSGIPDTRKAATFDSFRVMPGTEKAFEAAKNLVDGGQVYMVLIYGSYGNGKTHLAYAACRAAMKMGMRARFFYWPDLLAEHRRRLDSKSSPQEFIEEVKRVEFLALDEIGFTNTTEFQAGLLEEIVNHRYNETKHTIMTTNRDIKALPGALVSRLRDREVARIVLNQGHDYRPGKAML